MYSYRLVIFWGYTYLPRQVSITTKSFIFFAFVIQNVAAISAGNDEMVGNLIAEALDAVGADGVLSIETSNSLETTVEVQEGMMIDRGYISPQFVTNLVRFKTASLLCRSIPAFMLSTKQNIFVSSNISIKLQYTASFGIKSVDQIYLVHTAIRVVLCLFHSSRPRVSMCTTKTIQDCGSWELMIQIFTTTTTFKSVESVWFAKCKALHMWGPQCMLQILNKCHRWGPYRSYHSL